MAPSILLYQWSLKPFGRVGWLACFVFLACAALRLARFNVQISSIEKKYFQGLPSPIAAGIVATSVTAAAEAGVSAVRNPFVLAMAILIGLVMVSNFRYHSFKEMDLRQRKPFFVLIVGVCLLVFIATKPEVHLFIAFLSYALLGAVFGILAPARKKITQVIIAERQSFRQVHVSDSGKASHGELGANQLPVDIDDRGGEDSGDKDNGNGNGDDDKRG
jgi:phosphatidylserine synthase